MTTTTINQQIQALKSDLAESQDLLAQAKTVEIPDSPDTSSPSATQPPRVMLAFLMGLSIGLSLGAAGVAIAGSLFYG